MLDLYVLYACVHLIAGKHSHQAQESRCIEAQIYLRRDECRSAIATGAGLTQSSRQARSWLECQETRADSWIPAEADEAGHRLYKASAGATDENSLAVLLAPLSPEARAALAAGDLKSPFERAFQGPGNLSFFVVGSGSRVTVFAVTRLDDFQFADMAADVSSSSEEAAGGKDLDIETVAEDAGIELSYHTEVLQRAAPPPGGVEVYRQKNPGSSP